MEILLLKNTNENSMEESTSQLRVSAKEIKDARSKISRKEVTALRDVMSGTSLNTHGGAEDVLHHYLPSTMDEMLRPCNLSSHENLYQFQA